MPSLTNLAGDDSAITVKAGDLVSSALREIGIGAPGEALAPEDSDWGLEALQRRIDLINAQRQLIYAVNFEVFQTPANTQPITIGPGAQFDFPAPPIRIESATWILPSGGTNIDLPPMRILTDQEWAEVSIKNLTSTLPTALYYSRGASVGNINLLPIPNVSQQIRLQLWSALSQALALATNLSLPPGYWMYLLCAVASDVAHSYGPEQSEAVSSPSFMLKYREASNAIRQNNQTTPPLKSDAPNSRRGSVIPDYNFLTGFRR